MKLPSLSTKPETNITIIPSLSETKYLKQITNYYSLGYPLCKINSMKAKLFSLLKMSLERTRMNVSEYHFSHCIKWLTEVYNVWSGFYRTIFNAHGLILQCSDLLHYTTHGDSQQCNKNPNVCQPKTHITQTFLLWPFQYFESVTAVKVSCVFSTAERFATYMLYYTLIH